MTELENSRTPDESSSSASRPAWMQQALEEARASASPALPAIQGSWGNWLRYLPWDWFVTVTFSDSIHVEQAHRRWNAWIRALENSRFRERKRQPMIWIRSAELQRRQVLHYHSLLARVNGVPTFFAMKLWEQIGGGFARVVPYDVHRGGAYYLVKHADDIDLSACWFDESHNDELRR